MKAVVFDPYLSTQASKAHEWVPCRVGTDGAIALGMLNVILNEIGKWDDQYLKLKTNAPYLIQPDGHYLRDKASNKPLIWDAADGKAKTFDDEQFNRLLDEQLADVNVQHRRRILEAAAITAYHTQQEIPVVQLLLGDDAPQFKRVTPELALCWVHDARYYKKLSPAVDYHRCLLAEFRDRYWTFYDALLAYQDTPSPEQVPRLETEFDKLV